MGQSFTKLYSFVFAKKETYIVMAGLSGAGKTTILYKLKLGKVVSSDPTIGYNIETLEYKNVSYIVWDFGAYFTGLQIQRQQLIWKHFFHSIQGLIYVVDSTEHDRLLYAKNELHMMLDEDVIRDGALLVLANKQDLPNAMNVAEITDKLDLHSIQNRSWHIQSTCATSGEGLYEGFDWLSNIIAIKA